ncbi:MULTISPECIES: ABC transporter ATP-binding protein [unclassified Prosthecochloris]|uniref:ABC transporter ATP-binding protein n=1 Tax=unclassified Prosthecochloris TaxID=2632826 RepID=UPI00223DE19F|nr:MULTISPECIES: ABC transporter ATP-binding protein [unclassified Prosthecochloris]UZJ39491.1 ABC transporter ATP-binding protein [Prosthecochloris sp. SCSIO W1102]
MTGNNNDRGREQVSEALISLKGVTKEYQKNGKWIEAVSGCDLDIAKNEFLVIVGPTGSGKSTLLKLIAGFEKPEKGEVLLDGEPVNGPGSDRGMIFQEYALLPWRTVLQNVELGLEFQYGKRAENRELAMEYIDMVGLSYATGKFPVEMSGGMKRRASLAMILVTKPKILLMDGPFNALDSKTKLTMHTEITRIWEHEHNTIIFVTSELDEAVKLSDRIAVMNSEGRISKIFTNDLPRPRFGKAALEPEFHHRFIELREKVMNEVKAGAGKSVCDYGA